MTLLRLRDRRLLLAILAILTGALLHRHALPRWTRWTAGQAERAWHLRGEVARANGALVRAPHLPAALNQARERFLALAPRLVGGRDPATTEAALLALVAGAATTAGLDLRTLLANGDSARGDRFRRVAVRGEGTGDVDALLTFLRALAAGPALITIRELAVDQPQPGAGDEAPDALQIRFVASALGMVRRVEP